MQIYTFFHELETKSYTFFHELWSKVYIFSTNFARNHTLFSTNFARNHTLFSTNFGSAACAAWNSLMIPSPTNRALAQNNRSEDAESARKNPKRGLHQLKIIGVGCCCNTDCFGWFKIAILTIYCNKYQKVTII